MVAIFVQGDHTRCMQLAVGDHLEDRYVIDRPIARGGMATVYRCIDTRLGREVAAKVMHEQYVHDPVFRDRFRREARAMAQLSHPNLVNVYDFSAQGETIYLIMELITGGTLRELLNERGPMPPHAAAAVMRGMLTGLSVAHSKGMIHRDIKPDNVLIDSDHRVKLADFGLVRAAAEASHSSEQIVGTVSYLSPEQVDGSPMTPASDVYSAGILLFELLTGRTPFSGETPLAHAYARIHADVPAPSQFIDGVPKLFDELVATATARQPADRFRDAQEFLTALDDVAQALDLPNYSVPAPQNSAAHRAAAEPPATGDTGVGNDAATTTVTTTTDHPATDTAIHPNPGDYPVSAPQEPPSPPGLQAPPQALQKPRISPVSNRRGAGFAIFVALALVITAGVAVGGWWFGSGLYGTLPPLIAGK